MLSETLSTEQGDLIMALFTIGKVTVSMPAAHQAHCSSCSHSVLSKLVSPKNAQEALSSLEGTKHCTGEAGSWMSGGASPGGCPERLGAPRTQAPCDHWA